MLASSKYSICESKIMIQPSMTMSLSILSIESLCKGPQYHHILDQYWEFPDLDGLRINDRFLSLVLRILLL